MSEPDHESVRRHLRQDALAVRSGLTQPLELDLVLERLGARRTFDDTGRVRGGSGSGTLIKTHDGWEILLPGTERDLTPRDRFTVAHEIGHVFLDRLLSGAIMSAEEYDRRERLCDEFAGHLLLPPDEVGRLVCSPPNSSRVLFDKVETVAKWGATSFQAATHALLGHIPNVAFWGIELTTRTRRTHGPWLRWRVQNVGWVDLTPNSAITTSDPFHRLIECHREVERGVVVEGEVCGVNVASVQLSTGIRSAALVPPGARMSHTYSIQLSEDDRLVLQAWAHNEMKVRRARRARIVLLGADGLMESEIALRLRTDRMVVRRWVSAYIEDGVAGLC